MQSLPRNSDDINRRIRQARIGLLKSLYTLWVETDPEVLERADGALWDVLLDLRMQRSKSVTMSTRDSGRVSPETAFKVAYGNWRCE